LLVQPSGYDMRRAVGSFRKVGFGGGPYPVDWKTRGPSDIFILESRFLDGVLLADIAVREWIGLIAYRVVGRTDELFPSPLANEKH